jgi:hypothetical protein
MRVFFTAILHKKQENILAQKWLDLRAALSFILCLLNNKRGERRARRG